MTRMTTILQLVLRGFSIALLLSIYCQQSWAAEDPTFTDHGLLRALKSKTIAEKDLKGRRITIDGLPTRVDFQTVYFQPEGLSGKIKAVLDGRTELSALKLGVRVVIDCKFVGKRTFGPVLLEDCRVQGSADVISAQQPVLAEPQERLAEPLLGPGQNPSTQGDTVDVADSLVGEQPVRIQRADPDQTRTEYLSRVDPQPGTQTNIPEANRSTDSPPATAEADDTGDYDHLVLAALVALTAVGILSWAIYSYCVFLNGSYGYRFWRGRLVLAFGASAFSIAGVFFDSANSQLWAGVAVVVLFVPLIVLNVFEIGLFHGVVITSIQVVISALAIIVFLLFLIIGSQRTMSKSEERSRRYDLE